MRSTFAGRISRCFAGIPPGYLFLCKVFILFWLSLDFGSAGIGKVTC